MQETKEVRAMIKQGIDISAHNGNIDWTQTEKCIDAVIIRAGYGKNNIDQKWVPNVEAVLNSSLDVGCYWFSYAYTEDMAYLEGRYAALAAQKKFGSRKIPVAFDLEYDSVEYAKKKGVTIDRTAATKYAIAFMKAVKELGFRPMLYTNVDYIRNYFDLDAIRNEVPDFLLWLACWGKKPDVYGDMADVWQNSSKGTVAGIKGNVDMDEVYVDLEIKGEAVAPVEPAVEPSGQQKKVTATILNIRKEPSAKSEDLGDLPKGTVITVDRTENGWAHVEGWLSAQYLK